MLRRKQHVFPHDAKFIKVDIVQEHIDATKVIGGQVNLLTEKAPLNVVLAQYLFCLQQQRTGATGGVIDFIDPCFANGAEPGQQLGNICRVKYWPPFLPALAAYMLIRYS